MSGVHNTLTTDVPPKHFVQPADLQERAKRVLLASMVVEVQPILKYAWIVLEKIVKQDIVQDTSATKKQRNANLLRTQFFPHLNCVVGMTEPRARRASRVHLCKRFQFSIIKIEND